MILIYVLSAIIVVLLVIMAFLIISAKKEIKKQNELEIQLEGKLKNDFKKKLDEHICFSESIIKKIREFVDNSKSFFYYMAFYEEDAQKELSKIIRELLCHIDQENLEKIINYRLCFDIENIDCNEIEFFFRGQSIARFNSKESASIYARNNFFQENYLYLENGKYEVFLLNETKEPAENTNKKGENNHGEQE